MAFWMFRQRRLLDPIKLGQHCVGAQQILCLLDNFLRRNNLGQKRFFQFSTAVAVIGAVPIKTEALHGCQPSLMIFDQHASFCTLQHFPQPAASDFLDLAYLNTGKPKVFKEGQVFSAEGIRHCGAQKDRIRLI